MKNSKIIEAMQYIDEDLIEETVLDTKHDNRKWIPWATSIAACICLGIIGFIMHPWNQEEPEAEQEYTVSEGEWGQPEYEVIESEEGVTIPPMEAVLSAEEMEAACMVGFFIYDGRCYVHYDTLYEDVDLVDEHLGTITGSIDAWTPQDGYVDGAGSVHGEIYSVKGYDPSFMLCMKEPDLSTRLFICDNGITLKKGSDLFEDRLQLTDGYINVQYETHRSWHIDMGNRYELEADNELMKELVHQLKEAPVQLCDREDFYDKQEYHLYFNMKNGMSVHLRLSEEGYVCFDGMLDVCVQLPETLYKDILSAFGTLEGTAVQYTPGYTGVTIEECKTDPELGTYVPEIWPEEMSLQWASIYYDLDTETAKATGTQNIDITYVNDADSVVYLWVQIGWMQDYGENGYAGPVIEASQLSLETVEEYMQYERDYSQFDLGIQYEEALVVISGCGIPAQQILQTVQSIR